MTLFANCDESEGAIKASMPQAESELTEAEAQSLKSIPGVWEAYRGVASVELCTLAFCLN